MTDPTVGPPDPVPPVPQAVEDDPRKPYKAIVSGVLAFVAAFLSYWIADSDPFTAKEAGEAVLSGLLAAGLIGGGTFAVANPKRVKPLSRRVRDQRGESYIGLAVGVLLVVILVVVLFRLL